MVKNITGEFYVYELAYSDSTVFYVGKGKGNRINQHEEQARKGKQSYKCNVIRQIWRDGGQVLKRRVQERMSEEAAYALEIDLIRMYGREHLTNMTDGGEGGKLEGAGRKKNSEKGIGEKEVIQISFSVGIIEALREVAGERGIGTYITKLLMQDATFAEAYKKRNQ